MFLSLFIIYFVYSLSSSEKNVFTSFANVNMIRSIAAKLKEERSIIRKGKIPIPPLPIKREIRFNSHPTNMTVQIN